MATDNDTEISKIITKPAPNVQYSTYLSWDVSESFDVDVVEIEHRKTVTKIWCTTCRKHAAQIRLDSRLRGQAKTDCSRFADGSTNVVKVAVKRHLRSLVRIQHF